MTTFDQTNPDPDASTILSLKIRLPRIPHPTYQSLVAIQGGWGLALFVNAPYAQTAVLLAVPVGALVAKLAGRARKSRPVTPVTFLINVIAMYVMTMPTGMGLPVTPTVVQTKLWIALGLSLVFGAQEVLARKTAHVPPRETGGAEGNSASQP